MRQLVLPICATKLTIDALSHFLPFASIHLVRFLSVFILSRKVWTVWAQEMPILEYHFAPETASTFSTLIFWKVSLLFLAGFFPF
jgi:hypothetical protein